MKKRIIIMCAVLILAFLAVLSLYQEVKEEKTARTQGILVKSKKYSAPVPVVMHEVVVRVRSGQDGE